jgi:hypothetical protein
MTAEIIQFIPRPLRNRESLGSPAIPFRSALRNDDLASDHADTAPCEYVAPCEDDDPVDISDPLSHRS